MRTLTLIAAFSVEASAGRAQARTLRAFVHVNAHHVGLVKFESGPAGAHEAAKGVAAPPVVAQIDHVRALVNVLQDDSFLVGFEAASSGTHQLVFLGAWARTFFTEGPPGPSRSTTTG